MVELFATKSFTAKISFIKEAFIYSEKVALRYYYVIVYRYFMLILSHNQADCP